jgi:hypothetical protein
VQAALPWLGRGLVHIERFPEDAGFPERNRQEMVWRDILRRVQEVAHQVPADWYMFTNADEFREAPWPRTTLADAFRETDDLGYNAVKFQLFDFRPTDDRFVPGADPRRQLRLYEPGGRHDILQIKAWKRPAGGPFDLVEHGGHDVVFPGKRVFPVPFILRHYPIRSSEHGRRKVLGERLPRFAAEERQEGWHVQYDRYADGGEFLHDPAELHEWKADAARSALLSEALRDLLLSVCVTGADPARSEPAEALVTAWLARREALPGTGLPLESGRLLLGALRDGSLPPCAPIVTTALRDLSHALESHARLRGEMVLAASIADARRPAAAAA